MIQIKELGPQDVGKWVEYRGGAGETERGRITSWTDKYVRVVYKCDNQWQRFQDFTGCATDPGDSPVRASNTCRLGTILQLKCRAIAGTGGAPP
jgi:hypothetical protein